ncbi:MAG: hypothetical protein ABSD53_09660 [Terriglobales bacterium]
MIPMTRLRPSSIEASYTFRLLFACSTIKKVQKASWSRDQKLAVIGWVVGGVIALIIGVSAYFVPEVRQFLHLDKSTLPAQATTPSSGTPQADLASQKSEPPIQQRPTPKVSQRTTARVKGNGDVAGNNVSGDKNVIGNNNQIGPTANAPNGIAITGGTVYHPTVNNYNSLRDLTMSDAQEKQVSDSLGKTFTGADVSIMTVQANQNTRDFSSRLARICTSSGATVELMESQMYAAAAGTTLHKGMSITSFPTERKETVDKFANALGTAGVIQVVPIYEREDKTINIVINRSVDTPDEAKQY